MSVSLSKMCPMCNSYRWCGKKNCMSDPNKAAPLDEPPVVKKLVESVTLPSVPDTPESVARKVTAAKELLKRVGKFADIKPGLDKLYPPPSDKDMAKIADEFFKPAKPSHFKSRNKTRINIWIDNDGLEQLRALGPGWQTKVNQFLRDNDWLRDNGLPHVEIK